MRDEETGSYWQQVSGRAIAGPFRGRQLELVHSDELTFGLWRGEKPRGSVLRAVDSMAEKYEPKDWEERVKQAPVVVSTAGTPLQPRELILGMQAGGAARAYMLSRVLEQKLIQDWVGGIPVMVVAGPDGKSVRVFERPGGGDFYMLGTAEKGGNFMDSDTGSRWNFQGCAVDGPSSGRCLTAIPAMRDFWFDWHLYHPQTTIFVK